MRSATEQKSDLCSHQHQPFNDPSSAPGAHAPSIADGIGRSELLHRGQLPRSFLAGKIELPMVSEAPTEVPAPAVVEEAAVRAAPSERAPCVEMMPPESAAALGAVGEFAPLLPVVELPPLPAVDPPGESAGPR